jgi:hypothetical protein
VITTAQTAQLITDRDITPNLPLVIQRGKGGIPIEGITLDDLRDGIARLKAAIRAAELLLS